MTNGPAQALKALREDAGLTIETIAAAVGLPPATITAIETGNFRPSPKLLGLIAEATLRASHVNAGS